MERLSVIAAELAGIVKKHDPTRPVLSAAAFPELSSRIGFFDSLDIVGYNYKEQLYEGDHARFPRLPIFGSENGHHLSAWKTVRDTEYIGGQFLWTGIDFMGEAKGWPVRGSAAGLLDLAGYEKTGYFRRKALWSGEPFLYLVTRLAEERLESPAPEIRPDTLFRSWNYPKGRAVELICYTSLKKVELFCNGKRIGFGERGDDREYIAWTIPFERGTLEASGITDTGTKITDTLESVLPGVQINLRLWKSPVSASAGPEAERPGDYRFRQVELEILDEDKRLCVTESPMVQVSLEGPGRLLGIENGDLSDCSEYASPRRRAFRGRLIIYALLPADAAEKTALRVSAEGYRSEAITL
jgi:hypothetical protein